MKTKTEFKLFIGLDWDKEKNYLSNQHKNGWSFTFKNVCGFYYFAECEPKDMVYHIDYNADMTKYDYLDRYRKDGWEYVLDSGECEYFRKPALYVKEDECVFSNEARFKFLKQMFKLRILPIIILLFMLIFPNLIWAVQRRDYVSTAFIIPCMFYCAYIISKYIYKYNTCKKECEKGKI